MPFHSSALITADDRVTNECKEQLRQTFSSLDPVHLLSQIREAQRDLAQQEVGGGVEKPAETSLELNRFIESLSTAWRDGEVRPTHRNYTGPRAWRTRADPFANVWPIVEQWLNDRPDANARDILQRLQTQVPDSFQSGQLRTLQRRVKEWRTAIARRLVLGCDEASPETVQRSKNEVVS